MYKIQSWTLNRNTLTGYTLEKTRNIMLKFY